MRHDWNPQHLLSVRTDTSDTVLMENIVSSGDCRNQRGRTESLVTRSNNRYYHVNVGFAEELLVMTVIESLPLRQNLFNSLDSVRLPENLFFRSLRVGTSHRGPSTSGDVVLRSQQRRR